MNHLTLILLAAIFFSLGKVYSDQSKPIEVNTAPIQYVEAPKDNNYRHGTWCLDGRVF